jgi:DNA-binding SARP family transcriptional activator/predicted ATPase
VARLQCYFLGPLEIRSSGSPLPRPATLKSQSLLAYLALHRDQPQPRDRLVGLFWAERSDRKARRSLSTALWHIRRCLPAECLLVSDAHLVQFGRHANLWLDVEEFEAQVSRGDAAGLQSALALYRGDLLEGFYDDWILGERYRLEAIFIEALARLMAVHEAAGDYQAALGIAQRLLGHDPLREDAHRLAMRTYCHLGRRNAALEQYRRCREIVRAELGTEPMGETRALHQAILSGDFRVGLVPETPTVEPLPLAHMSGTGAVSVGRSPLDVITPVRLVGREREIGLLHETWQGAQRGHGELVLISGEVGVGKTRLVEEFATHLRWQGARALCGRCYELERALPYQPFAEALHAALPGLPDEELAAFPAWALVEVARLVPDVQERPALSQTYGIGTAAILRREAVPPRPGLDEPGLDLEQVRLFEGVTHVLAALSSRAPLLLVLEDLHWAGESSLGLVHHLARHLADYPVLIVGTFRPGDLGAEHPLRALWRRLAREGLVRPLRLLPLAADAVETMIVEMSGAGEAVILLAERLFRETEGNLFFLMEIVKALFETEEGAWQGDFSRISAGALPLPASVSETIQARVRRLERSVQETLDLAAVLGREFDFDLLNAAWGRGEEATLEALDSLLRHRLVEERDDAGHSDFAFTHHKIQEVVYEGLPHSVRLRLHTRVGMAMESLYAAEPGERASELAYHFERACLADESLCDKAVTYLLQAGQQAVRQSANREAIAYCRRALDILHTLPETDQRIRHEIELQLALGVPTAVVHGYASPEAGRVYDRAHDLCRKLGHTPSLFTSLVGLARYYGVGEDVEKGMEIAEQLLVIAHTAQDNVLLIEAYRQMGSYLLSLGQMKEARRFCERGLGLYDLSQHESLAYRFSHDPAVTFLGYLSVTLWLLGYPEQAQAQSQELCNLMGSLTHPSSLALGHCLLAIYACMSHDVEATFDHAEGAIRLDQLHGLPSWAAMATALRGWALIEQGQAAWGRTQLRDGTTMWQARGFVHFSPFFLGLQAEACLNMRLLKEATIALSAACATARNGAERYWMAELQRLQGELTRLEGRDAREAEACFRQAMDTAYGQEATMLELRAATSLARLWQDQGRCQDARQVLAEVCSRFDEGFDTYDLQAAATLLRALA